MRRDMPNAGWLIPPAIRKCLRRGGGFAAGFAAACCMLANDLTGSLGALAAEGLIPITSAITIYRLHRDRSAAPARQGSARG